MFSQSSLSEPPSSARAFRTLLALGLLLGPLTPPIDAEPLTPIPAIERVLPPPGNPLSDADRTDLKTRAAELCDKIEGVKKANPSNEQLRRLPDVAIYAKAVAWAIDLDEFYAPRELETARELIQQATGRLEQADRRSHTLDSANRTRGEGFYVNARWQHSAVWSCDC